MTENQTFSKQATHAPPRYFLCACVGFFSLSIAALVLLRMMPLNAEMIDDPARRWPLVSLPNAETEALKLGYAENKPPYDVGLFGNSRILMVGVEELGLANRSVFNFAIGGESVRQSIRFLEELRALHKAPVVAIISMDHAELGIPGGLGVFPGPPRRWLEEVADVWIAWKVEGLRSAAVHIINIGAAEGQQMAITFNHSFVLSKLRALAGSTGPSTNMRRDGSHKEISPAGPVALTPMPRRADSYPQLESDFARLAAVRDAGTRVVVYESPVAPQFMSGGDDELSPSARDVRRRFHAACEKHKLECHGPPLLTGQAWFDRDHAPAALLAAWLRPLIEQGR